MEINQIHTKAGSLSKEKLEEVVCPDRVMEKAQGKPFQGQLMKKHQSINWDLAVTGTVLKELMEGYCHLTSNTDNSQPEGDFVKMGLDPDLPDVLLCWRKQVCRSNGILDLLRWKTGMLAGWAHRRLQICQ